MMLAFLVHTAGLLMRIYVSGRAPVTTLHSSAIFIGWGCVCLGMVIERIAGYSFGTLLGSVGGFLTLIIAFSLATEGDTFSVLQAVLDTQFWLSTHVVCITLGYSATFVAGALGIAWILASVLVPAGLPRLREMLVRLVYGVACFALLLSFTGTVLGGLWADDSWGRFWGWDPKENGALMIVLVNAMLLHARWAGMIRDRGIAITAVVGSMVTIWSWFAVNELGIGLHQYGLTEGRMKVVGLAWLGHLAIIGLASLPRSWWLSNLASETTTPAAVEK
jgi:ABC-type transport system involved in cytochrome c biogenesis permease subunit